MPKTAAWILAAGIVAASASCIVRSVSPEQTEAESLKHDWAVLGTDAEARKRFFERLVELDHAGEHLPPDIQEWCTQSIEKGFQEGFIFRYVLPGDAENGLLPADKLPAVMSRLLPARIRLCGGVTTFLNRQEAHLPELVDAAKEFDHATSAKLSDILEGRRQLISDYRAGLLTDAQATTAIIQDGIEFSPYATKLFPSDKPQSLLVPLTYVESFDLPRPVIEPTAHYLDFFRAVLARSKARESECGDDLRKIVVGDGAVPSESGACYLSDASAQATVDRIHQSLLDLAKTQNVRLSSPKWLSDDPQTAFDGEISYGFLTRLPPVLLDVHVLPKKVGGSDILVVAVASSRL